jgi:hypothetical protein
MLALIIGQILSYSLLAWIAFAAVAIVPSGTGKVPGMIVGHCVIAVIVLALDVNWVRSAMSSPTYNPNTGPDFDAAFYILFPVGVLLRVVAINTVLLPLSFAAIWVSQRLATRPVT